MSETKISDMSELSTWELAEVSGGVISDGSHNAQTYVAGRLQPSDVESDRTAGVPLFGNMWN